MALGLGRRHGVAVVELSGVIGSSLRISPYSRIFESVRRSRRYRALLLDIDSPGGSAAGSEVLYHNVLRVAEVKPVVAYIRGVGASGAYLLSCAASRVFSLPSALVGSIGVIYLRPVLEQLLSRVGVGLSVYKEGRLKDMGGFWRSATLEEDEKFSSLIGELYQNFVTQVAERRGMDEDRVKELATGEVFTGRQGQELGLVDELADFDQALETAAELGHTRPRAMWVRPRRPILGRLTGAQGAQGLASLLGQELAPFLSGGAYYLAPGYLPGASTLDS